MKHAVIFCQPRETSFTSLVAKTYVLAVEKLGHQAIVRDLYRIAFNPCLGAEELPGAHFAPRGDVAAERSLLAGADVYALIYPLWLNSPPAMMKGYLERVFGFGFAYGGNGGSSQPLLTGRQLIAFSSSGAPLEWVEQTGAFAAVRTLFDSYFAQVCGLTPLDHVHFGNVIPGASEDFVQARMIEVRAAVTRHFGGPA